MNKRILTVSIISILLILVGLELFYFRFHTYLQTQEVSEESLVVEESSDERTEVLAQGQFQPVDAIHKGSGTATIIEQGDMTYLRFQDDFKVTNGPDLYVYLTKGSSPTSDIDSLGEYIDLGRLKGNVGSQNYEIPESIDGYETIVIWCKQFGVLFSYAAL